MAEHHVIAYDIVKTEAEQVQAQVNIIVCDVQLLIHPSCLQKMLRRNHQACACHRNTVILQAVPSIIIDVPVIKPLEDMGRAISPVDDSVMLDPGRIRVEQLRSDRPDVFLHRLSRHPGQPVILENLNVIIEEKQIIPRRVIRADVAHPREVEFHLLIVITDIMSLCQYPDLLPVFLTAAVVDEDDLVARIISVLLNRCDTPGQVFHIILGRNDDAYQGYLTKTVSQRGSRIVTVSGQLLFITTIVPENSFCSFCITAASGRRCEIAVIHNPVLVHVFDKLSPAADAAPGEGFQFGSLICAQRVGLRLSTGRGRLGALTPVIQNLRDVANPGIVRQFQKAKGKIIVLGAVELRPQAAGLPHKLRPVHSQVVRIHHRQECVGRPVRLEERIVTHKAVLGQLVLVTVDEIVLRVLIQRPGHLEQRIWRENVVTVRERDEVALCSGDAVICRARNIAIFLPENDFDSLIFLVPQKNRAHGLPGGVVVYKDQLPVSVGLATDRLDAGGQLVVLHVVDRDHHTEKRCIRKVCVLTDFIFTHPALVDGVSRGGQEDVAAFLPGAGTTPGFRLCHGIDVFLIAAVFPGADHIKCVSPPELVQAVQAPADQTFFLLALCSHNIKYFLIREYRTPRFLYTTNSLNGYSPLTDGIQSGMFTAFLASSKLTLSKLTSSKLEGILSSNAFTVNAVMSLSDRT